MRALFLFCRLVYFSVFGSRPCHAQSDWGALGVTRPKRRKLHAPALLHNSNVQRGKIGSTRYPRKVAVNFCQIVEVARLLYRFSCQRYRWNTGASIIVHLTVAQGGPARAKTAGTLRARRSSTPPPPVVEAGSPGGLFQNLRPPALPMASSTAACTGVGGRTATAAGHSRGHPRRHS